MAKLRGEESWAAACLEGALTGVKVRQHDDGSRPSMHDLNLFHDNELIGACEVTAAAIAQQIELWNLLNGSGERHIESGLVGGWSLVLDSGCRVKKLKAGLRGLLETLEASQIRRVGRGMAPEPIEQSAHDLGIARMFQSDTDFAGSVYFTVEPPRGTASGFVPKTGDYLCEWLEDWIASPTQEHNIEKLAASGALTKHLFVILAEFSAPFQAADVLMRDDGPLPIRRLSMPDVLINLWVMSSWSTGDLFAWDMNSGWSRHQKLTTVPGRLTT